MMLCADAVAKRVIQAGDGEVARALLTEWGAAADDMNPEAFARWICALLAWRGRPLARPAELRDVSGPWQLHLRPRSSRRLPVRSDAARGDRRIYRLDAR